MEKVVATLARMDVSLHPVGPDLRDRVLGLGPRPEQERFAGQPAETLPEAEADPQRHAIAILENGEPVGFCVLHRGPGPGGLAPTPCDVLLRGFFVDAAAQGRGIATRALVGLPGFVAEHVPGARRIVLTVNTRNPAAIRTYAKAGFLDRGELYHGGAHGPQHILELSL
jgi:RimJ/RimL family protein N-acetyltransferase